MKNTFCFMSFKRRCVYFVWHFCISKVKSKVRFGKSVSVTENPRWFSNACLKLYYCGYLRLFCISKIQDLDIAMNKLFVWLSTCILLLIKWIIFIACHRVSCFNKTNYSLSSSSYHISTPLPGQITFIRCFLVWSKSSSTQISFSCQLNLHP